MSDTGMPKRKAITDAQRARRYRQRKAYREAAAFADLLIAAKKAARREHWGVDTATLTMATLATLDDQRQRKSPR